jgi:hypothetical protein
MTKCIGHNISCVRISKETGIYFIPTSLAENEEDAIKIARAYLEKGVGFNKYDKEDLKFRVDMSEKAYSVFDETGEG